MWTQRLTSGTRALTSGACSLSPSSPLTVSPNGKGPAPSTCSLHSREPPTPSFTRINAAASIFLSWLQLRRGLSTGSPALTADWRISGAHSLEPPRGDCSSGACLPNPGCSSGECERPGRVALAGEPPARPSLSPARAASQVAWHWRLLNNTLKTETKVGPATSVC
jgi:hypothetical protein